MLHMTTLSARVQDSVREEIAIIPYDPCWPELFQKEADYLRSCIPSGLIRCIEHFGSTAVPGLPANPVSGALYLVVWRVGPYGVSGPPRQTRRGFARGSEESSSRTRANCSSRSRSNR